MQVWICRGTMAGGAMVGYDQDPFMRPRELNVALTRLRLNSAPLNGYLYRIWVCNSPQCICGHGEESVHHFFLSCPLYAIEREQLMRDLSEVVSVSLPVILCGSSACNNIENERIVKAVHKYILSSKRFT